MTFNGGMDIKIILFSFVILGYFTFQIIKHSRIIKPNRRRYWILVRLLTLIFLILSLTGMTINVTSRDTTTIFLVDSSISMEDSKREIEDYINSQMVSMEPKDKAAIITFGKKPMVDMSLRDRIEDIKLISEPNPYFTDIQGALDFGEDYFPQKSNKRLVLITDGRENAGDALEAANELRQRKINLEIYPIDGYKGNDVQLTSIELPNNIHKAENIPMELTIDSTIDTKGTLYFYSGNEILIKEDIRVSKGANIFKYYITLNNKSNMNYRGEIVFKEDNNLKNNRVTGSLQMGHKPRVLVVGKKEDVHIVENLLTSMGLELQSCTPNGVADNIDFLSKFNGIFLVNIHHDSISSSFEANLNTCVKELGVGLIVVGGEESFALGGYRDTVLEGMLPVSCKMKGNKKQPNTGLVLIIDSSGSMDDESGGIKKIDMAKEAAIGSVGILEDNDYIGVLAFSDVLQWIVPLGSARDKEVIEEDIGKLGAKGGTLIIPSLSEGIKKLQDTPVKIKHIILLSDGQGEKEGYDTLINNMKKNNITLSTVAMGYDADQGVLKRLSKETKGRSYFIKDFQDIPNIFAKETYLATKKYINNQEFTPIQVDRSVFSKDVLPNLKGHIGTGIKDEAELILKSPLDDPILAQWQYGLGKVMVWTSDLKGGWSNSWIKWHSFQSKWASLISSVISHESNKSMELYLEKSKGKVEAFVVNTKAEDNEKMEMVVQGPHKSKEAVLLKQVATGKYIGSFFLDEEGTYYVTAKLTNAKGAVESITKTINLDYCPEYGLDRESGIKTLTALCNATDGRFIDKEINVFKQPIRKNKSDVHISFILLPLALMLFIADIAIRKF